MLEVRVDRALWPLLPPARRREAFAVPHGGTSSVGHLVEAAGVPLTEVGALRVGGATVPPAHRPDDGDTLRHQDRFARCRDCGRVY